MVNRARKILEEAMTLSEDERLDLVEQRLSSLPPDHEWLAELERRVACASTTKSRGRAAMKPVLADVEAYGVGRSCRRCRSAPESQKGVRM
jgi:hypothetical protein